MGHHLAARARRAGRSSRYLFLGLLFNRNADRPYVAATRHKALTELARRLDIRDGAGGLVDFRRTHRFRHTKTTSLLNAGVPIHVVQRYLGHLSPAMTMHYAQTLAETHEAEFLRYRKLTAEGRELQITAHDLYDMLQPRTASRALSPAPASRPAPTPRSPARKAAMASNLTNLQKATAAHTAAATARAETALTAMIKPASQSPSAA